MIGAVFNFAGGFGYGGFGSRLAGGLSSFAGGGSDASSRLIAGSALSSLADSRARVDDIEAALTQLRDALVAARDNADAVPGPTTLEAVTAEIEHYVDKPTYVTIDGEPVRNGTVTVPDGTRTLIVGYERVPRAAPEIGEALKVLLRATTAVGSAPGLENVGTFGDQIAALLKNPNFKTALTRPDRASLDSAIDRIDGLLTSAQRLGFAVSHRAAAASNIGLAGLLLGASPGAMGGPTAATNSSIGTDAYRTASTSTSNAPSGRTLETVA